VHRLPGNTPAVLAQLLAGVAAVATGIAGSAVDAAVAYAAQRHQFGGPIDALPVVRASLNEQTLRTAALARAVLGGAPDLRGSIAIARQGCEIALEVTDAALQIYGGYGYLREYPAQRSLRDAVSLRASFDLSSATRVQQLQ
jgi:alkylation response protein AidB-like acyl-CoA dehydrogenase